MASICPASCRPPRPAGKTGAVAEPGHGQRVTSPRNRSGDIATVFARAFELAIQIEPQFEGHARQVMLATIGAEPIWAKQITVVDTDVDIYDMDDVQWAILTRSRPDKDTIVIPDTPSFYRDEAKDHWGRMLVDATRPWGREAEFERKRLRMAGDVRLSDWIDGA